MNDRFKFRVWDIDKARYNTDDNFVLDPDGILGEWDSIGTYEEDGYIVEQCTGVKDKNGNLIYENDIVEQSPSGNKYKIIWIDTDCGWGLENAQTGFIRTMNCFVGDELEVIGNIHEQKEE